VEVELRAHSGAMVPSLVSPSPLVDPGGHLSVVRDFRDFRRRLGALEDMNRRLREGLGEVAVVMLHNVGNAVASLDVRVGDLADEIGEAESALRALALASDELAQSSTAAADERARSLVELVQDGIKSLRATLGAFGSTGEAIRAAVSHVARTVEH